MLLIDLLGLTSLFGNERISCRRGEWRLEDGDSGDDVDGGGGSCSSSWETERSGGFDGEGSANPTEPHHTPSPQEHHSPQYDSPPPSNQTIIFEPIPQAPTKTLTQRKYTRRAIRIAQSKALSPAADEPASLSRDDRQREAFPTVSILDAGQDKEKIAKTSALPHESSLRVPSLNADEGSMQQRIHELMDLYTSLQRQQSQMVAKIKDQDLEISGLKARVKSLEDKDRRRAKPTQEDAPITWG
nr:hypothetical protein [Tanacetum cinerariifolium]